MMAHYLRPFINGVDENISAPSACAPSYIPIILARQT